MEPSSDDDTLDDLPFRGVTEETLMTQYSEDVTHNGLGRKRTYTRTHIESNQRKRLSFDSEAYFYIAFHLRPYLMTLISGIQSRVLIWLAFGK